MNKKWIVGLLVGLGLTLGGSSPAWAVMGLTTPDPSLPPSGGSYMASLTIYHSIYGPAIVHQAAHKGFVNVMTTPSGPDEIENFDSTLDAMISVGGGPLIPVTLMGPVSTLVVGKVGNTTGTFATEMLSMNLTGLSPLGPVMIRESPTLPSLGSTSITSVGSGLYHIDSFFDVFTELSLDGGQNWQPSEGPTRVSLCPEPTSVSLLVLALLGAAGYCRRRK
jgi:hypothetical protein